jgi:hypothetical protein
MLDRTLKTPYPTLLCSALKNNLATQQMDAQFAGGDPAPKLFSEKSQPTVGAD